MNRYEVKYKVQNSYRTTVLNLHGGTESEAIEKLYAQSSVPRNLQIIILSIRPV